MRIKGTIVITDPYYMESSKETCLMERNTIYGDWACMVYEGPMEGNELPSQWNKIYFDYFNKYNILQKNGKRKSLYKRFKDFKKHWIKDHCIGQFCADTGHVGIFMYDDLDDRDKEWIREHHWCAAIIEDFDGEVEFVVKGESLHIVGRGNKTFFSTQSEL